MNPLGLILIGLGIILIIIGFKGSQHSVINAFKGIKAPASAKTATSVNTMQTINPAAQAATV